jgi:hypothetical protein
MCQIKIFKVIKYHIIPQYFLTITTLFDFEFFYFRREMYNETISSNLVNKGLLLKITKDRK